MKRITVIYGSPRENGNSDKLGKAFANGAKAAGHDVSEFYLRNLKINDCIGCEQCYNIIGECSQKDDMTEIYNRLYHTDCLVFVSPIYYQSFPGIMKNFIDRLYISENKPFPIVDAVLLATYASSGVAMAKMTKLYFKSLTTYHKWKIASIFCVSDLDEKDDITTKTLNEAYNKGIII